MPASAIAGLLATTVQAVEFNEIARFDIGKTANFNIDPNDPLSPENPSYIGSTPAGVAWNGSKLYVAGFDNGGAFAGVGIVEVLNATATGIVAAPAFSDAFGELTPPVSRGYAGLDIQGSTLVAAYDDGASDPNGLQAFTTSDNSLQWAKDTRGTAGPSFDPGFPTGNPALGTGVAWTTFGSGRRALQNVTTGADIHSISTGMVWIQTNPLPINNFSRDMDFDPDTGDVYVRRANDVHAATRTADNTLTNQRFLVDNGGNGSGINQQNLSFLSNTVDGDLIIYNDHPSSAPGQSFDSVIKVVDELGVAQTITFNLIGGGTSANIATGGGNYDFDYDPVSQTLALLDNSNRDIYIFKVGPLADELVGDYNSDGAVNAADYTVWRDNVGATDTLDNDPIGGTIGQPQYDQWVSQFGSSLGSGSGAVATPVPEPTMIGLLVTACFCFLGWSRRGLRS